MWGSVYVGIHIYSLYISFFFGLAHFVFFFWLRKYEIKKLICDILVYIYSFILYTGKSYFSKSRGTNRLTLLLNSPYTHFYAMLYPPKKKWKKLEIFKTTVGFFENIQSSSLQHQIYYVCTQRKKITKSYDSTVK